MINWTAVEKKLTLEANKWAIGYVENNTNKIKRYAFPEIEQNINEWAEDKPLTEIKVGEWSINMIQSFYPYVHFVDALECLYEYKMGGCKEIDLSQFDMK